MNPITDITSAREPDLPITLYTFAMSPYAWKVHSCLLYKRLSFQCFYVNPLSMKSQLPVGQQVPVLTVGDDSCADSTPIAVWLDELYPDRPRLLPRRGVERERALDIDRWVSERLIPGTFRAIPGDGVSVDRVLNGWRLARVMNQTAHGGLPWPLRVAWPLILSQLGFLRRARAMTDHWLPLRRANEVLCEELQGYLADGPFLGGRSTPSLPDLGAYAQLVMPLRVGMRSADTYTRYPRLVAWLDAVERRLAPSPPVLPDVVLGG
jgi:glutathione S-transferase